MRLIHLNVTARAAPRLVAGYGTSGARERPSGNKDEGCGKRGETVNFARVLKEVLWCLVTEGSISYRRIKLTFGLDDEGLEELRSELIGIKRLAADVDGKRLVLASEGRLARPEGTALSQPLPALRLAERPPAPAIERDLPPRRPPCRRSRYP